MVVGEKLMLGNLPNSNLIFTVLKFHYFHFILFNVEQQTFVSRINDSLLVEYAAYHSKTVTEADAVPSMCRLNLSDGVNLPFILL